MSFSAKVKGEICRYIDISAICESRIRYKKVEEHVERHAPFLFFLCVNLCVYYVSYVYFMIFFLFKIR